MESRAFFQMILVLGLWFPKPHRDALLLNTSLTVLAMMLFTGKMVKNAAYNQHLEIHETSQPEILSVLQVSLCKNGKPANRISQLGRMLRNLHFDKCTEQQDFLSRVILRGKEILNLCFRTCFLGTKFEYGLVRKADFKRFQKACALLLWSLAMGQLEAGVQHLGIGIIPGTLPQVPCTATPKWPGQSPGLREQAVSFFLPKSEC